MKREEFERLIKVQGIHETEIKNNSVSYLNITKKKIHYIYQMSCKNMFKSELLLLKGIYSEELNALIGCKDITDSFKKTLREDRSLPPEGTEKVCLITTRSEIRDYIESEVNKAVTDYIQSKYNESDVSSFTEEERERLSEASQREDIARYIETGIGQYDYKSKYIAYTAPSYEECLEFLADTRKYIQTITDKYIAENENREHYRLVENHMLNIAINKLHDNSDHPARLKRMICDMVRKNYKEVSIELNEKFGGFTFSITASKLRDPKYVLGLPINIMDYDERKIFKDKYPDIDTILLTDIKAIYHSGTRLYGDYLIEISKL